jgi:hypothetical protein
MQSAAVLRMLERLWMREACRASGHRHGISLSHEAEPGRDFRSAEVGYVFAPRGYSSTGIRRDVPSAMDRGYPQKKAASVPHKEDEEVHFSAENSVQSREIAKAC